MNFNWTKKKRYLVLFLLIFIVLIWILVKSSFLFGEDEIDLQFSAGLCELGRDFDDSMLGIKESSWLKDGSLQVKVYVLLNCAEQVLSGNFSIEDDKIILKYSQSNCELCTLCTCPHELVYRFSGLRKNDYKYEVQKIE